MIPDRPRQKENLISSHGSGNIPPATDRTARMSLRFYRIALSISLIVNILLIAAIWTYVHFEGLFSIIQSVVGIFG